jgi:hypothetical protein
MFTELGEKTVPPCPTVTFVVAAKAATGSNNEKKRASRKFTGKFVEPEPNCGAGYQEPRWHTTGLRDERQIFQQEITEIREMTQAEEFFLCSLRFLL